MSASRKNPKRCLRLLVAQAERLEHARLHVLPVNSNAARAEFVAVEHEIVALRAAFPWRGFELVDIFFVNSRERMLRAHPALVGFAPFKKREAGDPREFPFAAVDQIQFVAEMEANLPGDVQRRIACAESVPSPRRRRSDRPALRPRLQLSFFSPSAPRFFSSGDEIPSAVTFTV